MQTLKASNIKQLETKVNRLAEQSGIHPHAWQRFLHELTILKQHNQSMYAHSLRVGLYTYGLAKVEGMSDLKFPLFAGCGHDIGKCEVDNSLLNSKHLQSDEFEQIKEHTTAGYNRLKDHFLFTAFVAGLHHKYQVSGYGIDPETDLPAHLSDESKETIKTMARLVMIADFFDALTTRDNNKGLINDPSDPTLQAEVMARFFPDQPQRVAWLIANKIE